MAKFTCPFCIREYDKSKVLYVALTAGLKQLPADLPVNRSNAKTPPAED